MCGVNIAHVVDTVRNILRLPKDAIPTTLRILDHGSYNKLFLIQFGPTSLVARVPFRHKPSANDPIGIASQVSTSQFLSIYRPKLPVPKILYAELNSANKANVPFVLYELCNGTRLTWQKWSRTQTAAQKANIVDLLAEKWAQLTEPVPFMAIGSILADASGHPPGSNPWRTPPRHRPHFRIISIMPRQPPKHASTLNPCHGHDKIDEYWHQHIELTHRTLLALNILDDLPDKDSLDEIMRCVEIMHEIADFAASPRALPHHRWPWCTRIMLPLEMSSFLPTAHTLKASSTGMMQSSFPAT